MTTLDDQQFARVLGRAAELQEQAAQTTAIADEPTEGRRGIAELQAAAAEAGIDEKFVALAALELAASPGQPHGVTAAQRRRASRWLGAREPALVHVQRFRAPIDRLLAALGATVQAPRYGLRVTDTLNDPRRGGTMLLAVPDFAATATIHGTLNLFAYYLRGVFDIEHVRLDVEPRGDQDHDVSLSVDLAQGWAGMSSWGLGLVAVASLLSAVIAWAVAGKLAAPLLAAAPLTAAVAAVAAWLGLRVVRWWYEHAVSKVQEQLREVLRDVDAALRSQAVFGVLPPTAPPAQARAEVIVVPVSADS